VSVAERSIDRAYVIVCAGSPHQRGEAHGEALRPQIADGLARWRDVIAAVHGMAPDRYITEFVQGTNYLPAIRRWTPALLAEVEGIARGADQPWEWIFACNLLDEEWTWASTRRLTPPGCTAIGCANTGSVPLLAQTMDINAFHDGAQAVIRVESDDGPDVLMLTGAGMIGLTGCNTAGLALVVNNLDVLPASPAGLPVAFAIRGVLERRSLQEAVQFLGEVNHATGQHYGLASPEGLASVEAWGTGITVAPDPRSHLLHTNHPLTTKLVTEDAETRFKRTRTRERLAYLEQAGGACSSVPEIQDLLTDRTVPVSLDASSPSMTFGAVVYECSVPPTMHVALGPPHQSPFQRVDW
jgi:isopenicillin-N N-acyltransferase-like protein